jgi:hypothetical protein
LLRQGYLISNIKYKKNTKQIDERILKTNYEFLLSKISKPVHRNADTSFLNCNCPTYEEDIALSPGMLKKENNRENSKEYNTHAQNHERVQNFKPNIKHTINFPCFCTNSLIRLLKTP